MCRYCNFDIFTHYLLNDASILKDESINQGVEDTLDTFIPDESDFPIIAQPDRDLPTTNSTPVPTVNLNNTNNSPQFNEKSWDFDGSRERLYGRIAIVDRALNFTYSTSIFNDEDGDTLTYRATLADGDALPSWLNVDTNTGTFTGTPSNSDLGIIDIKLIATDPSGATASTK